jgi:hypothetical protein
MDVSLAPCHVYLALRLLTPYLCRTPPRTPVR